MSAHPATARLRAHRETLAGLPVTPERDASLAHVDEQLAVFSGVARIKHVLCNCECRSEQTAYEALAELDRLVLYVEQVELGREPYGR